MDAAKLESSRRKLRSRDRAWAQATAAWLTRTPITPDAISVLSVVVSLVGGAALYFTTLQGGASTITLFLAAAACVQARLLCNLFDGMVAERRQTTSAFGEIFNDFPDRISDLFLFIGAGYAAQHVAGPTLGWTCGVLAVLVAYVRVLGRSCGTPMRFLGPMAKQHRMAALTTACVASAVVAPWGFHPRVMQVMLVVVTIGCVATLVRRLVQVARDLKAIES